MTQLDDESDSARGASWNSGLAEAMKRQLLGYLLIWLNTLLHYTPYCTAPRTVTSTRFAETRADIFSASCSSRILRLAGVDHMPPPSTQYTTRSSANGYDPATLSDDEESDARSTSSISAITLGFSDGAIDSDSPDMFDWKISRIGGQPVSAIRSHFTLCTSLTPAGHS